MNAFERERQIRVMGATTESCDDSTERRRLFPQMAALIRARTPQTVAAMEGARGRLTAQTDTVGRG